MSRVWVSGLMLWALFLGGCAGGQRAGDPHKRRVIQLVSTDQEAESLVFWYDGFSNQVNIFDKKGLEEQIEKSPLKGFEWKPGSDTAMVTLPTTGGAVLKQQAPVKFLSIEDMAPRAIYARPGDLRFLKYRRKVHTFNGQNFACSNDLSYAPLARPGNTRSFKTANRAFRWLQFTGNTVALETVRYTARRYYYPGPNCTGNATPDDQMPRWTIWAGPFPP
ncbi:MAG: hypothetical protein R3236_03865 [Phycisphaeraceae bacterium]|nr:hypothetical protein [Phycisphaeraceae bacterium]